VIGGSLRVDGNKYPTLICSQVYTKGVAQPIRGTVAATVQIGALKGVEPDTRTEQIFAGHEVIQVTKIAI
jgi:hypothetical protein